MKLDEVYTCADEVNVYLQDFTNWYFPIFPLVPGCPRPVFEPGYFVDGSTEYDWTCVEQTGILYKLLSDYKNDKL